MQKYVYYVTAVHYLCLSVVVSLVFCSFGRLQDKRFQSLHLIELLLYKKNGQISIQVKSDRNDQTESVIEIVKNSLSTLGVN